jgi:hypothetical protein
MAKSIVFSGKAFLDIDRIIEFNNRHRNKSDTNSRKFLIEFLKRLKLLIWHAGIAGYLKRRLQARMPAVFEKVKKDLIVLLKCYKWNLAIIKYFRK